MHIEYDHYVYWPINVVMSPLTVVVNLSFASPLHTNQASETQTTHKPDHISNIEKDLTIVPAYLESAKGNITRIV